MSASPSLEPLLALIGQLADGAWHSGEVLGEAECISRAALAKRIERLREVGLMIEARHGLGYRLAGGLQRLRPEPLLRAAGEIVPGCQVRVAAVTDSTNREIAEAPPRDDPQALFAEFQTAGRGRRGRAWRSPFAANLYLSLAWSFPSWPPRITTLPLAVGVAVARTVRDLGVADVGLKWPNDVLVAGRKLGGVLIEHRGEAADVCRVVVGVGLNVAMSSEQAAAVDQPWTTLHQAQAERGLAPSPRQQAAERLLAELLAVLERFQAEGFEPFRESWSALDLTHLQTVTVSGGVNLSGIARGVDEFGALLVETPQGPRALHAGDVSLRLGDTPA